MQRLLPMHQASRCRATTKRSGKPCRSPAVKGWAVCRMHGAGGGAPRGNQNALKHGRYAAEALLVGVLSIPTAPNPYFNLIHLAGDLHQHAGHGVRYVIVRAGGMVDAVSTATHAPALQADELRTETYMVQQLGPATVQDREEVAIQITLRYKSLFGLSAGS
jgi:hypothetical protein